MPAFNGAPFIAQAIESIISQSFPDWELIICDDGSTDDTAEIVRSFSDRRIRFLQNRKNLGLVPTLLRLIDYAESPYVGFLDCDDVAMPHKFQQQIDFLNQHPDCALCGSWGIMIDESGAVIKKINLAQNDQDVRYNLLFSNQFIQSSIVVRRAVLNEETYDVAVPLACDYDLWCRLSHAGHKMQNLPCHLVKYRWHASNISKTKQESLNACTKAIFKRELAHLAIDATEDELAIHLALRDKSDQTLPDAVFLDKARRWLKKLSQSPVPNPSLFRATLCLRWIYACKERKAYGRMLLFPAPLGFKGVKHLLRQLWLKK
jgi:glycosyltransferase involved in cell wall biosynthesis